MPTETAQEFCFDPCGAPKDPSALWRYATGRGIPSGTKGEWLPNNSGVSRCVFEDKFGDHVVTIYPSMLT